MSTKLTGAERDLAKAMCDNEVDGWRQVEYSAAGVEIKASALTEVLLRVKSPKPRLLTLKSVHITYRLD
ncbi:hypothetical protein AB0H12_44535 [Actinosynnema sp. NPDC023794]